MLFPICETLSHKLTWSHYFEILKAGNELGNRLLHQGRREIDKWSVRELKRQMMKSMLFHRIALSTNKEGVMKLAKEGQEVQSPADLIRDPFVLEFLNIPEHYQYQENELEQRLIDNLQQFLLELGKGFAFIGRQYRISLSGKHFYVDLVFYHRILKCFVLIDLKRGEIDHPGCRPDEPLPELLQKRRSIAKVTMSRLVSYSVHIKTIFLLNMLQTVLPTRYYLSKYRAIPA